MSSADDNPGAALERVRRGDRDALADAFARHRQRLLRTVAVRIDARLAARVSPDDVLQEAYVSAAERGAHLEGSTEAALFLWLRLVTLQTLIDLHRRHVDVQGRSVQREARRGVANDLGASATWSAALQTSATSPSEFVRRGERSDRLRAALDRAADTDREILLLRHFEELSNQEAAQVLEIEPKAASIRYFRALARLRDILESEPRDSAAQYASERSPNV